ncbi:MAG TPA: hypothetical protein VJ124_10315 [Pyrinomonadaceae bacterium]|nr:hypothetical protein [Pyrinomonadaceae bacterium]
MIPERYQPGQGWRLFSSVVNKHLFGVIQALYWTISETGAGGVLFWPTLSASSFSAARRTDSVSD